MSRTPELADLALFEQYIESKDDIECVKILVKEVLEEHNVAKHVMDLTLEIFDEKLLENKEDLEEITGCYESDLYIAHLKGKIPGMKVLSVEEQQRFNERLKEDMRRRHEQKTRD